MWKLEQLSRRSVYGAENAVSAVWTLLTGSANWFPLFSTDTGGNFVPGECLSTRRCRYISGWRLLLTIPLAKFWKLDSDPLVRVEIAPMRLKLTEFSSFLSNANIFHFGNALQELDEN